MSSVLSGCVYSVLDISQHYRFREEYRNSANAWFLLNNLQPGVTYKLKNS